VQAVERGTRFSRCAARAAAIAPILAVLALLAVAGARIGRAIEGGADVALLGLCGWLGLAAADLAGGLVHWACDRFGDERTPWIGPLVIAPFREHHVDPQVLARKDFFDGASSNAWLALSVLVPFVVLVDPPRRPCEIFVAGFVVSLCAAVLLTNTFHQWAHRQSPPRAAHWLRRLRIAIAPERHARHHATGDGAFCVTTGWCNEALDRWRVFDRLERALARLRFDARRRHARG
jgi:ubiquitin-conjugating enzyme E2 variant